MFLTYALILLQAPQAPAPERVSPARLRETLQELCRQPRLAGSPQSRLAADYVARVFEEAGLEVRRPRYRVHLPRQTSQSLVLLGPDGKRTELDLRERGFAEDPRTLRSHVPPMHGLTRAGAASGRVVYAGRGHAEEFAALEEDLGGDLRGTIALIRYGGLYRGLKVKNAEDAGCAGALLYTDRADDGADRGAVLPAGPFRPGTGIQRGSVYNADGDPLTPGWPAVEGARRIPIADARGLVGIPSLPVSWDSASLLFGSAGRPPAPGRLDAAVEMSVEQDPAPVTIENVLGFLKGGELAGEWVILGAHRDSWGYGAVDNGSGTAVLLEVARVLGDASRAGWRPARTLILATWDAEEWGLVGSTEWVEQQRSDLVKHGVAYLNMDSVASGGRFGASCTPGLVSLIESACAAEQVRPPESLGVPGGGSDHVPFLELAGMEVLGFGFHGGHGTYHSALDTPYVVEKHLDPGFVLHARAARLAVRMISQLSDPEARLGGVANWAAQAESAAIKLDLGPELRTEIVRAAADLRAAALEHGGNVPHPHRFLHSFLGATAAERSLLWQSSGYGSLWFPEVALASLAGEDPGPHVARASAALRTAALRIRESAAAVGR